MLGAPGSKIKELFPPGGSTGDVLAKNTDAAGDLIWKTLSGFLPTGGAKDAVLTKTSTSDYAVTWAAIPTPSGLLPSGGTTGDVLVKNSATNYDVKWGTPAAGNHLENGTARADLSASGALTPASSTLRGSLGTSSLPWGNLYAVGTISLGTTGYGSTLGFFGHTPQSKITLSTTSQNQSFTTVTSSNLNTTGVIVLNNIAGLLKNYGLIG